MGILKKILIAVLAIVVIALIVAAFLPKHFAYERSTDIKASKEVIYDIVNDLKTQDTWGPWKKQDPSIQNTYNEVASGVGQVSTWTSKKSGNGSQTITETTPSTAVKYKLDFGGDAGGDAWFKLEDGDTGTTKTSWGMGMDMSWPWNIMSLFMGGQMNSMLEQGLTGLKEMAEQKAAEAPAAPAAGSYAVKPMDFPGGTYLGIREKTTQAAVMDPTFFGDRIGKVMTLMQKSKLQPAGSPASVYFLWDDATKTTDVAVAMPVNKGTAVAGGDLKTFDLPASKALAVEYVGGYSGIMGAHLALTEYTKANGLKELPPAIEEYVTGPESEPDSNKWVTRITYFIEGK